jgi:tetratricopeptide (TPR) repeat protein
MGRYAEASKQLRRVFEIDESFRIAHVYMAIFQALEGLVAEARVSAERAYSLMPWGAGAIGLLAGIAARGGDAARAETLLTQLKSGGAPGTLLGWVIYHIVRLETDQAAEWFEKAIQQREFGATVLLAYVRKSSHWPKLARMMNLPETSP